MKTILSRKLRLLLLGLALFAATTATPASPDVLTLAIFDFEAKDANVSDLGSKVSMLLNARLSADPQILTVERAELSKVLGEQELSLSGTVNPNQAVKVGQLTGAKVLVTGRVFKVDKETIVVAKIIGTETSVVYGALAQGAASVAITDLAADIAKQIAATLSEKGDKLVAKVVPREDRLAKIKKAVAGKTLPSVSVKIGEHHFGRPVTDPAAETEIGHVLQECGFKLVDEKSKDKAVIEITGDAFSAFGLQKGNLISCTARIEIKAHDMNAKKLIANDRQTTVAVDIAEQTAAKTALQNGGFDLAERLIPQLAK